MNQKNKKSCYFKLDFLAFHIIFLGNYKKNNHKLLIKMIYNIIESLRDYN